MKYAEESNKPKWIDSKNPIKINGFDFIELATKNYSEIIDLFTKFGFVVTGRHRSRNILLLQQGELKFVVNAEMKTDASSFESIHGSGFCGTAFRVQNSDFALREAVKKGAEAIICADYGLPAIRGIGGSKIYLIDSQTSEHFFANFFETTVEIPHENPQVICVDHITYNVFRGNMEAWAKFYEHVFNFQEIRNFDIKGKKTGLRSKALISPCGKIRIPLNEPQDDQSQIAEFLKEYNGEGIQHIALSCHDIYSAVDRIKQQGVAFQNTPDTYYDLVDKRIPNHQEDVAALKKLKVLIDGNKQEDGILLQIFTKEVIGPIFFEFIERKGNKGFGEGNFQALFESIELDQIRRGVLSVAESFSTLSSAELVNYANPALAQVAFGGEEKGIGIVEFEKEHSLCQFLKQFSTTEISAASLSIFSILLHRYTSQEQFKLRQYQISEEICQLDLACNLTEKSCFRDLLESARQLYSDGFSYQDNLLDFNQHSNVSYSLAYFVLGISDEYINTLTNNHLATSEMCLMLDGDSHAYLAYDQALFDHNFIANFIRHFGILLDNIQSNYDRDLEFVGLTSQADITLQCDRWQTPSSDYGHQPIYRHFEQYAHKFPEAIAATFGDKQISYEELNSQANQLARYLIKQNVQPQDCIGVFIEPGIEILIAILAIHKINAVYVPIDTEYPLGRVKTVIDQVSSSIIIGASARLSEIEDNFEIDTINLPAINLSLFDRSNLNYSCSPDSISHIFFTSGTTGTPKGVVSSHSNLIHYIFAAQEKYRFGAEDSFLSATRYTFSISLLMLLLPLICGGQVNIITLEQLTEPKLLAKAIERSNFFHLGPSILKILLDFLEQDNYNLDRFSHVKHASSGGDMIRADILNRLNHVFTQAEVYAIYGSSEISCMGCTYFVPKDLEIEQTLVGKPFNNVGLRVLDQHQRVVPVGVKGEIYFSGQGITQGYLNLPHRTATQYVWLDDERFYRTGDIGRLTPQGNLQVLGRDDSQVQIRGMRIELGEIESNLNLHPAIGACVVIVKEDKLGGKQLVAYLIPQNQAPTSDELRRFLQSTLPQYMIPAHFVSVAEFPLNPNGKIDRRALADLKLKLESQSLTQPRTATQEQLVKIWSEVLKLDAVGIEDNFFELGGHSLLATQIISRIRETLEVEVAISSFFASPTIAALAKYIDTNSTKNSFAPILPIPRQDKIPLSLTQERLWFLYQLEPDSSAYNIPLVLEIKGVLQINTLERAIAEIVRRHETLRTNFDLIDNTPLQLISPSRDIPLKVVDLRSLSVSEGTAQLQELMETEIHRPFELTQEALLRTTLFQQTPDTQVLLVMMHHIVSDGWSLEIFTKELATIYAGIVDQQSSTLPELSIQYADFAHWQREYLQGEIYEAQLNYWQQQLAGLAPLLELPTDKTRPAIQSFHGGVERFNLSPELTSKLQNISKESGATLFMTLLASFATLLSRYSNSRDIAIGSPIANRNRSEIESLIGFFVNTLVLRTNLEGEPSFEELLQQVRQTTLDAYSHSDLQFDQLVEILQPERSLSHNPLFQVMFVLQNGTVTTKETSNLSINPLPVDQITAQFDLTLSMEETDRGLTGFWQYNSDLFETETIQRLADNFLVLLEQIVTYPEKPVTALPLITQAERQQLLVEWNDTQTKYPQDKCIHQLFEEQVAQTPDAVALVFEEQQLTYRELNTRANQLAYYLRSLGVKSEVLVGICVERSIEMVVGILAILKAGGAYVPLDPAYPSDRLAFIVEETQVKVLLTIQSLLQELPSHSAQVVCLDTDSEIIQVQNNTDLINSVTSDNLAYVMYTSGSTGRPKGVSVIHRGVVRLVKETNYVNLTAKEIFLMLAPISFDASTFEIWGSLLNGARLIIFPDKIPSPIKLGAAIKKYEVTTLWLTAALFHLMVDERLNDLKSLRQLLAGGDVLSVPHVQKVLRKLDCQLINGYGPTENTTFTCCHRATRSNCIGATVPIGLPIANTQVYVLDKYLQPVPIGVVGELHIGGDGLARDYFKRRELTEEKFIPNPFSHEEGVRLYKTGDLVRYLPDGNIEYLGRIDNQVKIRGFRIELGEIEAVLAQHPDIRETVVIAREDTPGDKRLVAYVVPQQEQLDSSHLRSFLKEILPNYMVPSAFVFLNTMPLTPNGKVDRRALPIPDNTRQESSSTFVAPQDKLESHLSEIWSEVLGIKPIGVEDNFFDLGGNSLQAVALFAQIEKQFGKKLPLATLFQSATVAEIAQIIRSKEWLAPWSSLVPIKPTGSKPPLFYIHAGGGNLLIYRDLALALGTDQPVYGLQPRGLDGKYAPFNRIEDMAAHYVAQIRKLQPNGPYFLAGLSSGGNTAWEIAQMLQAQSQEVALLALFDANGPDYFKLLPPIPRLLSVVNRVASDIVSRWSRLPLQIVHKLRQSGAKQTSIKALESLRIVKEVLDEDKIINQQKMQQIFQASLTKYKSSSSNISFLERWVNYIAILLLKHSYRSSMRNIFVRAIANEFISDDNLSAISDIPEPLQQIQTANIKAKEVYAPQAYSGKVTLFRASQSFPGFYYDSKLGWGDLAAGGMEIYEVDGNHTSIMKSPVLAEQLRICLEKAQAN